MAAKKETASKMTKSREPGNRRIAITIDCPPNDANVESHFRVTGTIIPEWHGEYEVECKAIILRPYPLPSEPIYADIDQKTPTCWSGTFNIAAPPSQFVDVPIIARLRKDTMTVGDPYAIVVHFVATDGFECDGCSEVAKKQEQGKTS